MQRKSVTSSNISAIGYDPETETLEVEFKGGTVYSYSGVTPQQHSALINADSIGSHFHKNIRSLGGSKV
jgi:hypothetical protein